MYSLYKLKTKETDSSVIEFIKKVGSEKKQEEFIIESFNFLNENYPEEK